MLDVLDFITERGGNPEKIRESQRRRYADEKVVDEIIAQWEDHRQSRPRHVMPDQAESHCLRVTSELCILPDEDEDQRSPKANRSQEEGRLAAKRRTLKPSMSTNAAI
jgi:hypothetical protein